jgi:regulator of sirC expression with transglutaminase-like and TPR domain
VNPIGDPRSPPKAGAQERCRDFLRTLAGRLDAPLPIAEAALAIAALERPRTPVGRYQEHLDLLAADIGARASRAGSVAAKVELLNDVILGKHGYRGDGETYDDLQNANLMHVIDRRKGLPVALGILYIHAARAQGWQIAGLGFPSHFLLRVEQDGERVILDPFHGGRTRDAAELRELLKAIGGNAAELEPQHYAVVSDREVLLRLQNNVKVRLLQGQQTGRALAAINAMLLFAPDHAALWREAGLLHAHLGNLRAAIAALETFLTHERDDAVRHQTALLVQQLRSHLN